MSITVDSAASASLTAPERGAAWLVDLDFTGGTLRFTNYGVNVPVGALNYVALGGLVDIGLLGESAEASAERITITLTVTALSQLAAAMGDASTYRGRSARAYLQLFDRNFQPSGSPVLRWRGYMDKVQVTRSAPKAAGPSLGRIELVCSRAGMARARNAQGLRLTDAQQQSRYPGDTGLRYVRTLVEQPAVWLSKRFQEQ